MSDQIIYKINLDGDIIYVNNKCMPHRLCGPAIEKKDGKKCWYLNGKQHRMDGPAIESDDGLEWWINGYQFSSRKTWFEALPEEDQIVYLFNMESAK